MKKLLLLALAACLPFSMAVAQMDPANYHIWFGTTDGSVISAGLDRDIEIPCWGSTDPAGGDSVTFMHNPLASDDLIITGRLGGFFPPPPGPGGWDDISFLTPNAQVNPPGPAGFTNQSVLGFAYLTDPRSPENFLYTLGALQMISTYRMHTTADQAYLNQTVCPFIAGAQNPNGGFLWGNQDGTRQVVPTQHYACLFFSPNADPVWTVYPAGPVGADAGIEVCFDLAGTDSDLENVLTITGPFGFVANGGNGSVAGTFCHTFDVAGEYILTFELSDGSVTLPMDVTVVVGAIGLEIGCIDAFPGANVAVPVFLHTNVFLTGGFEILIGTDPTALTRTGVVPTARINGGSEYFNVINEPAGAGSCRVVWIADINNGVPGIPAAAGHDPIFWVTFHVADGLPFGMSIPINFLVTDYYDNTISDPTGYVWVHPELTAGCVQTADPDDFKGDPNMNCYGYEIADAVLVAQRLIQGYVVWAADDGMGNVAPCDRHYAGNDDVQEAASDLNDNSMCDVADLVRFINIINGFVFPPKLDPVAGEAIVTVGNGAATINSGVEVGAVLVKVQGEISQVVANNMDVLTHSADGVTSVLVYSIDGNRIAAGNTTLFTFQGEGTIVEASASDSYGRLLDVTAREEAPIPTSFAVKQNYPNPFNAKTLINFDLPKESDVTISIYNITGQVVETISEHFQAGYISVNWDANAYASGIYFAKVMFGSDTQTVKMTLLK